MTPKELQHSFLLNQFYDFYTELLNQKKNVYFNYLPSSDVNTTIGIIQNSFLRLFEKHSYEAGRKGGEYGILYYKEAQYIMAGLCDEVFLQMEWAGKKDWKNNLLEFKLFGTNVAGEKFFQKLDYLLKNRDPSNNEIGAIYFHAISMGFRGKYRNLDDHGQLAYYRNQLFNFIFHKNPDLIHENKYLCPDAYTYTLDQGEIKEFPYLRNWIWVIMFLIVFFVISSSLTWKNGVSDLHNITDKIIETGNEIR
ncbi:MAG: DotU family type IV/VI secretion system protein [Desulfobacterales bacterium]|nr:DotU family type IV/VI secretion system protein [Desulfobacterales bacterium]